ncbi:hypothetical protein C3K47_01275 [Solitalea longa]|uniref:DUF4249 domain-containing protein n=1 Tax=Solitalea longa TaxID=2079460 RepID=A0A2S5A9F8_9SPHI|nr:DUF4249 domain-containing protein [Solitalea longa]POY39156.1 hypothetical protein C3K47_01275 [Solitalea longa]
MNKIYILIVLAFSVFTLSSCEDVVDVKLDSGPALLAVDGWLTNKAVPDTIKISQTSPYFSNTAPLFVTGAKVKLTTGSGQTEQLSEIANGRFLVQNIRSTKGETYTLSIEYEGEVYEAKTEATRQSFLLDSLGFEFREKSIEQEEDGYIVQFYGNELKGLGDACRIKIKRNNHYLGTIEDLNYMDDEFVDSAEFKQVRLFTKDPFQLNDEVTVETWSITMDAYHFYDELRAQVNNGGIFANPPANVRTNIKNVNSSSPKKAVGYFGASMVSTISAVVTENK